MISISPCWPAKLQKLQNVENYEQNSSFRRLGQLQSNQLEYPQQFFALQINLLIHVGASVKTAFLPSLESSSPMNWWLGNFFFIPSIKSFSTCWSVSVTRSILLDFSSIVLRWEFRDATIYKRIKIYWIKKFKIWIIIVDPQSQFRKIWTKNMAPERIELTTFALLARRSNQLSYGAIYLMLCSWLNIIQILLRLFQFWIRTIWIFTNIHFS